MRQQLFYGQIMQDYLNHTAVIDWQNQEILALARELAEARHGDEEIARACFEWVRDHIKHSNDYKMNPVTWRASDVLKYRTGYCYAKSHLLAALLRANDIPAALCYQRLSIHDDGAPYCLHGLNAVYLQQHGWYRIDARGNKAGVDARFSPPVEQLAFALQFEQERDLPTLYAEPLAEVLEVLQVNETWLDVLNNLPDIAN